MASNRASKASVALEIAGHRLAPGDEAPIGWADPFAHRSFEVTVAVEGTEYTVADVRRRQEIQVKGKKLVLSAASKGISYDFRRVSMVFRGF